MDNNEPRQLSEFPKRKAAYHRPWDDWFDGRIWSIPVEATEIALVNKNTGHKRTPRQRLEAFRIQVHVNAKRMGFKVRTQRDDENNALVIQASPRTGEKS